MASDDEDDYMNMSFAEPKETKTESSLQRRARLKREGELKGHTASKAEREAEESAKRETALATQLDKTNKGFKMMAKLGFTPGSGLGKSADARTQPIQVEVKEGRGGIGVESEKRKRVREAVEESEKRVKVDVEDYRQQVRGDYEERRVRGLVFAAMKTAERLDEDQAADETSRPEPNNRPLKSIDVTWRGLVKDRLLKEVAKQADRSLREGLEKLPTYVDETEDGEDKWARAADGKLTGRAIVEAELDESDEELEGFQGKEAVEQLEEVTRYLRRTFRYCFWCKHQYPDEEMDGCPGEDEGDHD